MVICSGNKFTSLPSVTVFVSPTVLLFLDTVLMSVPLKRLPKESPFRRYPQLPPHCVHYDSPRGCPSKTVGWTVQLYRYDLLSYSTTVSDFENLNSFAKRISIQNSSFYTILTILPNFSLWARSLWWTSPRLLSDELSTLPGLNSCHYYFCPSHLERSFESVCFAYLTRPT